MDSLLLLADPYLLDGGQGARTEPPIQKSVRQSSLFHCTQCQSYDLLLHPIRDAWVCATSQDSVGIEVFIDICITLHDGAEGGFMEATGLCTKGRWLEEGSWVSVALITSGRKNQEMPPPDQKTLPWLQGTNWKSSIVLYCSISLLGMLSHGHLPLIIIIITTTVLLKNFLDSPVWAGPTCMVCFLHTPSYCPKLLLVIASSWEG